MSKYLDTAANLGALFVVLMSLWLCYRDGSFLQALPVGVWSFIVGVRLGTWARYVGPLPRRPVDDDSAP